MNIKVLYFAAIREKLGKSSENITVDDGISLKEIMGKLSGNYEIIAEMDKSLMVAVNREYRGRETILREGDEIAIIAPVSGGLKKLGNKDV